MAACSCTTWAGKRPRGHQTERITLQPAKLNTQLLRHELPYINVFSNKYRTAGLGAAYQHSHNIMSLAPLHQRNAEILHFAPSECEICERCSVLVQTPGKWRGVRFRITETPEELSAARCQFCQFFAKTVVMERISDPHLAVTSLGALVLSSGLYFDAGHNKKEYHEARWGMAHRVGMSHSDDTGPAVEKISYGDIERWVHESGSFDQFEFAAGRLPAGLKVIDCAGNPPEIVVAPGGCRYVALSYVWGDSTESVSFREGDHLCAQLPRTIADSIEVTRNLDLRYLWIDRYVCRSTPKDYATDRQVY